MRPSTVSLIAAGLIALIATAYGTKAVAQSCHPGRYSPLDHRIPGRVTEWNRAIYPHTPEYVQQMRIELPSIGLVTFYDGSSERNVLTQAPSQAGMMVGRTYRIQISGMPEYPGVELYPSIELVDRLHPPAGREQDFPIPIPFTAEDIETALEDRLVTKVIYLEQPQWARPQEFGQPLHTADLSPSANLMQAADRRGRAMAIVRLGGRTPSPREANPSFYGDLAPVITQQIDVSPSASTVTKFSPITTGVPFGQQRRERESPAVVSISD